MEATCPHCGVRLELPDSGPVRCPGCGAELPPAAESRTAERPAAVAVHQPRAGDDLPPFDPGVRGPTTAVVCPYHPGSPAARLCERCGDFLCALCATPVEGRIYCPKCFELLYRRGALGFVQRQFTLPDAAFIVGLMALLAGLVSFTMCFFFVAVPLAIGGILLAVRALREHDERPELPGRGRTLAGLVLSVLALVIGTGEIVVMFVWLGSIAALE